MVLKNNSCTYSLKAFFFLSFSLSPFESYLKLLDLLNFINNNNKYPLLDKPPPPRLPCPSTFNAPSGILNNRGSVVVQVWSRKGQSAFKSRVTSSQMTAYWGHISSFNCHNWCLGTKGDCGGGGLSTGILSHKLPGDSPSGRHRESCWVHPYGRLGCQYLKTPQRKLRESLDHPKLNKLFRQSGELGWRLVDLLDVGVGGPDL